MTSIPPTGKEPSGGLGLPVHSTHLIAMRDRVFLAAILIVCAVVYAGFFFPDATLLSQGGAPRILLWVIRLGFPLLVLGAVFLFVRVRRGKTTSGSVGLLLVATTLSLFLCYFIGDIFYQSRFDSHRHDYHPYLQLMPLHDSRLEHSRHGSIKVFCLGGSTTEFTDHAGRDWPSRVEEILRVQYGTSPVEVYNCGRQWYTSLHSLINYETNLRKYRPNLIIVMQSINDLLHNAEFSYFSHGAFRDDYGHFYGPVNRIVDRRSLWYYLSHLLSQLWYASPRRVVTTDQFPGLDAFRRNIRTIVELARNDSAGVMLMSEPFLMKKEMTEEEHSAIRILKAEAINDSVVWSGETLVNGMEQYNHALESIAQQEGLQFLDVEKVVPKSLVYFTDEVHYQDTTFALIAPIIAAEVSRYLSRTSDRN